MSARVPVGFIETIMHFTAPGQAGDVITTAGWSMSAGDVTDFAGDIIDALGELMGNLSDSCTFSSLDIRVGQDGADDVVVSLPASVPGSSTGDMLPLNNCVLLQKRTSVGGRRGRGRSFLPGIVQSAVNEDGTLDGAYTTGITTNLDDCRGAMRDVGTSEAELYLLHQSTPFTPSLVTTWLPSSLVSTQRRRLR